MRDTRFQSLPSVVRQVAADVAPFFDDLDTGRFALSLGGSVSRGTWDDRSDIDFRLYHERALPRPHRASDIWRAYYSIIDDWAGRGVVIDGILCRTIADVDARLDALLSGHSAPEPLRWTIWGYHILPDISQQIAVLDAEGVIVGWQARLAAYPEALAGALLTKHLDSIRYWRSDYHYRHKVEREDVVFLAGLSTRLVHDMVQIVCALNRVPFPGDGNNLRVVDGLPIRPERFRERVTAALYPSPPTTMYTHQYETILSLIDDIEALVVGNHRL